MLWMPGECYALAVDLSTNIASFATGTYTVTRRRDIGYHEGRLLPSLPSTLQIEAVVVPLDGRKLLRDPEGRTGVERRRLLTATPLLIADATHDPDTVMIDGAEWEVESVGDWSAPGGFYDVTLRLAVLP